MRIVEDKVCMNSMLLTLDFETPSISNIYENYSSTNVFENEARV